MILFPAIDIRNGNCVRLVQGDYNQETVYGNSPSDMALRWQREGAKFLHLIDLDGAKTGNSLNSEAIKDVAQNVTIPVQVGGGVRTLEAIEKHISSGVSRVIIGTAAINDRTFLNEAVATYKDKIAVSIDAREGFVATDGWTETSNVKALYLVKELEQIGVETVVYTDIYTDGMLKGPNFKELQEINEATSIDVIASGGVTTTKDIETLQSMNMYGAIIGKALYDGNLNLEAALKVGQND